jgi:hypothetical protein
VEVWGVICVLVVGGFAGAALVLLSHRCRVTHYVNPSLMGRPTKTPVTPGQGEVRGPGSQDVCLLCRCPDRKRYGCGCRCHWED